MQPIELSTALANLQTAKQRHRDAVLKRRWANTEYERVSLELHEATTKLAEVRNRLNKYLGEDERG